MFRKTIPVLLLYSFVVPISAIVTQDKSAAKHHLSPHLHQTKNTPPHYRQSPQKCDLICPGQPPLALPPNFMQNCTVPNNTTQSTANSTSSKPSPKPSSTTESSEGGNESEESTEASADTSTTKKTRGGETKKASIKHQKPKKIRNQNQLKKNSQVKHHQHQNKKHLKKEKVLLKGKVKQELFKDSKHFSERTRLDGCYVVCSEGDGQPLNNGNPDGSEGTDSEESGSEESGDNYTPGEDNAVEIIYVPGRTKENQRPFELYQTNYAFFEPEPVFGYGYDPFFMEGKQKKIKKRKQNSRKATDKTEENHKKVDSKKSQNKK